MIRIKSDKFLQTKAQRVHRQCSYGVQNRSLEGKRDYEVNHFHTSEMHVYHAAFVSHAKAVTCTHTYRMKRSRTKVYLYILIFNDSKVRHTLVDFISHSRWTKKCPFTETEPEGASSAHLQSVSEGEGESPSVTVSHSRFLCQLGKKLFWHIFVFHLEKRLTGLKWLFNFFPLLFHHTCPTIWVPLVMSVLLPCFYL